jgi:hypothetical protein
MMGVGEQDQKKRSQLGLVTEDKERGRVFELREQNETEIKIHSRDA